MEILNKTNTYCKSYIIPSTEGENLFYDLYVESAEDISQIETEFLFDINSCEFFSIESINKNKSAELKTNQQFMDNEMIVKSSFIFPEALKKEQKHAIARIDCIGNYFDLIQLKSINHNQHQLHWQIDDSKINPVLSFENRTKILFIRRDSFSQNILLRYRVQENGTICFRIHDMIGQMVFKSPIMSRDAGDYFYEILDPQIASGLYICTLEFNKQHSCSHVLDYHYSP